jgi:hypothetical protein
MHHLPEKQGMHVKPPERKWIRMRRVHRSFSCILKRYIPATRAHVVGTVGVYGLPIAIQLNAHLLRFRRIEDLFTKSCVLDVPAKSRCPTVTHVRNSIEIKGGLYVSCRPDGCIVQSRHDCRSIGQQIVSYANGYLYHTFGGLAEPLRLTHGARVISWTPGVKYLLQAFAAEHVSTSRQVTFHDWQIMQPSVAIHGFKGCPAYGAVRIVSFWNAGLEVFEEMELITVGSTFF